MSEESLPQQLPVLPLRDVVVYPHMVIPLFVGRSKSIRALEAAMASNKKILLVAQKAAAVDEPSLDDIYRVGCVASILQLLKLPDGTVKVLVEGVSRAKITDIAEQEFFEADIEVMLKPLSMTSELEVLARSVVTQFEQYVKLNNKVPVEILSSLPSIEDISRLADTIAAHMTLKLEQKQELLEVESAVKRLEQLMALMDSEIEILNLEKRIRGRVKTQMERSQREYYLNEQIKAIQKELGEGDSDGANAVNEIDVFEKKIKEAGMTEEAMEKCMAELRKLKMMSPMSAEATVSRNYIDCMINIPWQKKSKISRDLHRAEEVLEEDHYGLEKVKERILEYLAVQKRVKKLKGPVLCLVGPPGVGKTSLGQSIAKATGRKFVRMSLGGVRDEAEIRGHRRTYIGSMPGKILQKLSKVGVRNPLFLLDEIDKMAMDFRGDPASALLEVLDPEQNDTFNDHYLEVDYDLSDVMFIATANSMNIPLPLLDRMEVIRIPGYTEDEKRHIVEQHLLPKQMEQNGLHLGELHLSPTAILDIIRYYTREAGVRSLERELAKLCRKAVRTLLMKDEKQAKEANKQQKAKAKKDKNSIAVTQRNLEKYLGVKRHRYGLAEEEDQIGHVTGLAWTEVGGELLHIEVATVPGKGQATYTGSLGDVMQESIQAAMTVVRHKARLLGIHKAYFEKHNFHVHVPAGATPKDGPSAGIGMCTAIISFVTNIPVKCDVAMTGEITLRGEVLPIGGLKEKLLAAHRGGIKTVIIPDENRRDLKEIPKNIKQDLTIRPVKWIDEVLTYALTEVPTPLTEEEYEKGPEPLFPGVVKQDSENDEDESRAH